MNNIINKNNLLKPKTLLTIAISSLTIATISIITLNVMGGGGLLGSNQNERVKADSDAPGAPTQSLSLSISNNIELSIPKAGGAVSNYHDLTIRTTNITNGYNLTLTTETDNNKLTNNNNPNKTIDPTTNTKSNPSTLQNNTWGYSISNRNNTTNFNPTTYSQVLPSNTTNNTDKQIAETDINSTNNHTGPAYDSNYNYNNTNTTDTYRVAYAARVDDITKLSAGNYTNTVVYTLTANPIPAPTITSITPETYKLGDTTTNANQITITGTNLQSTYSIYLDLNNNNQPDNNEYCTNIQTINNNTQITCNIPTDNIEPGNYNLHLLTQGGEVAKENAVEYKESTLLQCTNNNPSSSVQVDIDANMIPIRYVGNQNDTNSGWVKADKANTNNSWYNYNNKQWANAVTVTDPTKYKNATEGTPILNSDIKGYWVYIPRYDYCVKRFNASDSVVQPENFNIQFKKATDEKSTPTGTNTWATHPAFTWGDTELNGFWMAKFELTGPRTAPTVLPNKVPNVMEHIGSLYNIIKSIGVKDPENTGGGCTGTSYCLSTVTQYNQHNLNKSSSHMLKNSEWGAAAYLSASKYGAGVNNVQINAAWPNGNDDDGSYAYGITGCGPQANGNEGWYSAPIANGACGNTDRQYTGTLGQLASTTNNIYGIYDMSGGLREYVMGNYNNLQGYSPGMTTMPTGKYINIYPQDTFTNNNYYTNYNQCTWQYCGGHALHETLTVQEVSSNGQSWGGDNSSFVGSGFPWALRGGGSSNGPSAGVFSSYNYDGNAYGAVGARAVLVVPSM